MNRRNAPWAALAFVTLVPLAIMALAWGVMSYAIGLGNTADAAARDLQALVAQKAADPAAEAPKLLIAGPTEGLAAAALQALILEKIAEAGPGLDQIEAKGTEVEGALTRVRATVRLNGDEAQIVAALLGLEGAVPLIFIDRLQLSGSGEGVPLTAELDLSAYAGALTP